MSVSSHISGELGVETGMYNVKHSLIKVLARADTLDDFIAYFLDAAGEFGGRVTMSLAPASDRDVLSGFVGDLADLKQAGLLDENGAVLRDSVRGQRPPVADTDFVRMELLASFRECQEHVGFRTSYLKAMANHEGVTMLHVQSSVFRDSVHVGMDNGTVAYQPTSIVAGKKFQAQAAL